MLDYQYFKNHYKLITVDLSKQKELDADPRDTQRIEFYGMLGTNSKVCTVLEKIKINNVIIQQRNNKSFVKNIYMVEYNTVNAKLSDSQLNKLKSCQK